MILDNSGILSPEFEYKLLIDGNSYTYSQDITLQPSTSIDFHILTSNSTDVIINVAEADVFGAETEFIGYSESTVSANGTEVFAVNHNRKKKKPSKTKLFTAPTVTDLGDFVSSGVAFAANQPGKIALAKSRILSKYILVPGTSNILRVTNRSTTTETKLNLTFDFVEVEL